MRKGLRSLPFWWESVEAPHGLLLLWMILAFSSSGTALLANLHSAGDYLGSLMRNGLASGVNSIAYSMMAFTCMSRTVLANRSFHVYASFSAVEIRARVFGITLVRTPEEAIHVSILFF